VLGRPLTVRKKLQDQGLRQLDYFAFRKYSGLDIMPVLFWDDFTRDFEVNRDRYDALYRVLQDEQSRRELARLLNFRLSADLNYMDGFQDIQYRQYFEDFLELKPDGEVFLDVGCYDGYTTTEFIRRCPGYASIHVFEPEPANMEMIRNNLAGYPRIHFHPYGLSNRAQTLKFMAQGSASRINSKGDLEIRVDRLDDTLEDPFSFLKIDIEGGELPALEGARQAIARHRPRLAVSVYHRHDDLWRIPAQVLSCRDDYRVFLRHYTEGVTETVMFFVPKK